MKEEKKVWDDKARTMQDDIELRGSLKNPVGQLIKSRTYVHKLFKKSGKKNLLLDIGCGNGLFTVPMAGIFNFVVGVDFSKAMMRRCRDKRANLDFVMASATDHPIKDHVFDAVLSLSLLQHLRTRDNVEKVLKEISRIATDDSFVLLTFWDTPNSPANFVKNILKKQQYNLKQSLASMLQFTGFQFTKYVKLQCRRR